jgi:DUF1680 family protein
VAIEFDMRPRLVQANPRVPEGSGKVAVQLGPILYCAEQTDHHTSNVMDIALNPNGPLETEWKPELLGGVTVIRLKGAAFTESALYHFRDEHPLKAAKPVDLLLIPYYAWANRDAGAMTLWLTVLP